MSKNKLSKKNIIILIISIVIIVTAIIVGAVAINNSHKMSKEEMIQVAEELKPMELTSALNDNILNAKEKYNNHVFIYKGYVEEIESDHVKIGIIDVYLDKDTLKTLNKWQKIEVVGVLNNVDIQTTQKTVAGTTYEAKTTVGEMKQAYFINDTFEFTGTIDIAEKSFQYYENGRTVYYSRKDNEWYCNLKVIEGIEYSLTENVEESDRKFKEQGDTTINGITIKDGDKVKVVGKVINPGANTTSLSNTVPQIQHIQSIEVIKEDDNG